mmetsp:Transcript_10609/g.29059  ORF Transcript_10609/g.29059 Transcript_10609/m.29059 type:complete len:214 (-) Transcript_10609:219-860(-)
MELFQHGKSDSALLLQHARHFPTALSASVGGMPVLAMLEVAVVWRAAAGAQQREKVRRQELTGHSKEQHKWSSGPAGVHDHTPSLPPSSAHRQWMSLQRCWWWHMWMACALASASWMDTWCGAGTCRRDLCLLPSAWALPAFRHSSKTPARTPKQQHRCSPTQPAVRTAHSTHCRLQQYPILPPAAAPVVSSYCCTPPAACGPHSTAPEPQEC